MYNGARIAAVVPAYKEEAMIATVIATMLGHLIRCLYYRDQRCVSVDGQGSHNATHVLS